MARRSNDDDKKEMRRPSTAAGKGQEKEKEEDQDKEIEKEGPELESVRAQNQMGNQGVLNLMETAAATQAGVEIEMAKRNTANEKEGVDYGGEDDPFDPAALDRDLFGDSWNLGTQQPTERPDFIEPMPDDELPPEDPEFVDQLAAQPPPPLPPTPNTDALLQPSVDAIARSLRGWSRAVERWTGNALHRRAWGALARHGGPLLSDPHGRVLFGRARTATLCTLLCIDGQVVDDSDTAGASLLHLLLELETRHWQVRSVRMSITDPKARPNAADLFAAVLGAPAGEVVPRRVGPVAAAAFDSTLQSLLMLEHARHLVPRIAVPSPAALDDDDPLGIDGVLAGFTGGAPDAEDAVYRSALQAAERLAAAMQLSKIRMAGVAVAISEVCRLHRSVVPNLTLYDGLKYLDEQCMTILNRLRELARACQKRSLPIPDLVAALDSVAHDLEWVRGEARKVLTVILAGTLESVPEPRPITVPPPDPLSEAWADGNPGGALPWLRSLPHRLERDAAIVFTELAQSNDVERAIEGLEDLLGQAAAAGAWPVQAATITLLTPCLLRTRNLERVMALAREHGQRAFLRRNGLWIADAALAAMEAYRLAGRPEAAVKVRLQAGTACWTLGAHGAVSLLSRWTSEIPDDTEEVPRG